MEGLRPVKLFDDLLSSGMIESKSITEKGMNLAKKLAGEKAARFQSNVDAMAKAGTKFDVSR
jgi:hypothetical protein